MKAQRRADIPVRREDDEDTGNEIASGFLDPFQPIESHAHRLPHWQQGAKYYFVTWHLADSIPQQKLRQWRMEREAWCRAHPEPWDEDTEKRYHARFSRQIDRWLDAGMGSCVLGNARPARKVADAILYFDTVRYDLEAFVVTPNHCHVLFRLWENVRLEKVIKGWKGVSAREVNKLLGLRGTLWHEDYWDRIVRNERHFRACLCYILMNPVKAGLAKGRYVLYVKTSWVSG